jgi:DNA polymerase (family 10)
MAISNTEIANAFYTIADLLELRGENAFRVRAYRTAAQTIESLPKTIAEMIAEKKDLTKIPGIGEDLAEKMQTLVRKKSLPFLTRLKKSVPKGLLDMLQLPGLGPKKVIRLYKELHIKNLKELQLACDKNKIQALSGFGKKVEQNILSALSRTREYKEQLRLDEAEQMITPLLQYLTKIKGIESATVVGSYRRCKETVGDIDILVVGKEHAKLMKQVVRYDGIKKILAQGENRAMVLLRSDVQVDFRIVSPISYGAALLYFTGSKAHGIALRKIAIKKHLKLNEYGLYAHEKNIASETEKAVYKKLGLEYIAPELREDRGEIEAAKQHKLPILIEQKDLKGDLHAHTTHTDGRHTLKEMADAAQAMGYEYLAITDHSKRLTVAHGLDEKRLLAEIDEIKKLNKWFKRFRILTGIEVDILEDGTLDLKDNVLKELNVVVCSIHSKFNLPEAKQTERLIRAMDNPYCQIIGHPTGRLINRRPALALNMEKIFKAAKERKCVLEINSQPDRLDLNDLYCQQAKAFGLKFAISSDSHSTQGLQNIHYGIGQARRGWLESKDVINTYPLAQLKKLLKRS